MNLEGLSQESQLLAEELDALLALPSYDSSERVRVSAASCSLSLEHWDAARALFSGALLPSALVVHLATNLNLESEQAAKNLPQVADMMLSLAVKAPPQAYSALSRFKDNSWKALNSYAHAGLHPLRRHEEGYPIPLAEAAFRNANGLAIFSGMQAVVLSGRQPLQKQVLELAARHPHCMPPPL
jgi:hypothetical protein